MSYRQVRSTLKLFETFGKINRKGSNFKNLAAILHPEKKYKGKSEQEFVRTGPLKPFQNENASR